MNNKNKSEKNKLSHICSDQVLSSNVTSAKLREKVTSSDLFDFRITD